MTKRILLWLWLFSAITAFAQDKKAEPQPELDSGPLVITMTDDEAQNRNAGNGGAMTNLVASGYNFSQARGTYTPITGGTQVATGTVDEVNYPGQPIGFTFTYDGVDYTQLGVNSNGFIWFGTTAPATNTYTPISSTGAAGSRIVSALGGDLQGLASGELRIETIGTAPNRVCVIQWSNFRHFGATGDNYNFQIHLREADGRIEFHYGAFTKDATGRVYEVGLRGTSNMDFNNRRIDWNNSARGTANSQTLPMRGPSATLPNVPANGLIYKFVPTNTTTPEVDVTNIYTLGRVAIPFGNPVPIQVRVRNLSASAVTANVTVTVKNLSDVVRYTDTQTSINIPANSATILTFTGWNPTIAETDSVVAEITETSGNETDLSNNRIAFRQIITLNQMNYGQDGLVASGGVGTGANTGSIAARFTTNSSQVINQVGVNFTSTAGSVRVAIWDDDGPGGTPGTLLGESTTFTPAIGLNTIAISPAVTVNGDFFVGVRQMVATSVGFAYQAEDPIRAGTFYFNTGSPPWSDFSVAANPFRFMIEPRFQLPNDVGVSAITSHQPNQIIAASLPTNIVADVFNYGSAGQTNVNVFYNVNNGAPIGPITIPSLPSGGTQSVTFSGSNAFTPPAPGNYTIKVFTTLTGDGDAANDTTQLTLIAQPRVVVTNTTPYFEDFEASAGGWIVQITGGANSWVRGTPAKTNINAAFSGTQAWVTGTTGVYANNHNAAVLSPIFDLSALTADPTVSFRSFMNIPAAEIGRDAGVLEYSTNGGINWVKLGVLQVNETDPQALNWYNNNSTNGPIAPPKWSTTGTGYILKRKTLESLAGQASVLIRLRFGSDGFGNGEGWAFDDFRITPDGPSLNLTGNSVPIANGSATPSLSDHTDFGFANTGAARLGGNVHPVPTGEIGPLERKAQSAQEGSAENAESVAGRGIIIKPVDEPILNALSGTVTRTFTITNTGPLALNITLPISITGPNALDFSVTANPATTVAPSGTTTFQITFNPSSDGVKNATVSITSDDPDDNPFTFAIRGTGITSLPTPYFQSLNVDGPTLTSAGWTIREVAGAEQVWSQVSGATLPSGATGFAARANFFSAAAGNIEILQLPFVNLPSGNPVLNFDVAYRSYAGENDQLEVVVSLDGGQTFTTVYDKSRNSTPSLATLANSTSNFTPSAASQWRHETVDLSSFAGQTDVLIGFRATSAFGNNLWLANVTIQTPTSLTTQNVASPGSFSAAGLTINFTTIASGGNLYISRFNSAPTSDATTEFATNTSATTPDGSIFTPDVVAPRWWIVTYDGQTLGSSPTYDVSIDITGIQGVNNPDRLYILRRSNRFASWVALSTTRSGSILTAAGLTGFSDFVIGGDDVDNPLPVNLGSFTGANVPRGVELRWETISETDNAGFDVRRAEIIDGVEQEWLTVASHRATPSLVGQGTTSQAHNYRYVDEGVQVGKTYRYALRSTDLNGAIHDYPQTVTVEVTRLVPRVFTYKLEQNYPNPFNPSTRIIYQIAAPSEVKVEVFDMLGRKVATLVNERKEAGEYSVNFNASGLSSGVYFYRLQTEKFVQTKKMMLLK